MGRWTREEHLKFVKGKLNNLFHLLELFWNSLNYKMSKIGSYQNY